MEWAKGTARGREEVRHLTGDSRRSRHFYYASNGFDARDYDVQGYDW